MIPLLQTKTADTANTECDQVLFLFVVIVVVVVAIVVVVVVTVVVIVVAIVVVATVVVIVAIVVVVVLGGAQERGYPFLFCCSELQCTIVISHVLRPAGTVGRPGNNQARVTAHSNMSLAQDSNQLSYLSLIPRCGGGGGERVGILLPLLPAWERGYSFTWAS